MFRSPRFRKFALCFGLAMTAVIGAPIPPDKIADLLRIEQQTKVEFNLSKDDEDTGEGTDAGLPACVREHADASHEGGAR